MVESVASGVRELAGRYQIGELLGQGGMADVHLGTDSRLGRRVAIKLLKPSLAGDPSFRTRFRREAQDAAKMAHPTIVRIFDAGEETVLQPGEEETLVPYIVMEYVDGTLLKDMVAQGPLAPEEAARIVGQILVALEYSHRAGVVHRDIKPGNIMITTAGQVKVMDFGIARAIADSTATIAETSAIVGTASYFSPEQARGEAVDARTDLYSTGIVLFELLTGNPPFQGKNPVAVAYQHVNSEVPPPSTLNPKISPALDAVALRSVAKDRFDRYQTARDFRDDVATAAAGSVPARKQIIPMDAGSTLFGVNPSSTAGSEAAIRQLTVDRDNRVVRTQNRPPVAWIWAGIAVMVAIVAAVIFWTFTLAPVNLAPNLSVSVPNVSGQAYEAGKKSLEGNKLRVVQLIESSSDVPSDRIIRTSPEAGTPVSPGERIKVYVSSGEATVGIPDVARMSENDAIDAIEAANLVYGTTTLDFSPDLAEGEVVRSDPAVGQTNEDGSPVREGDTINLVVSNGRVNVPDVTGQPIKAASDALSPLQVPITVTVDRSCGGGTVASQSVTGEQPQRTAVALRVCSGG